MSTENRAEELAKSIMESIRRDMYNLENWEELVELVERSQDEDEELSESEQEELAEFRKDIENYGLDMDALDEDVYREEVEAGSYSVQVRTGWHSPGEEVEPEEYSIELAGGGPACRLVGELDGAEAYTAYLEYQDWGTPWTRLWVCADDSDYLKAYANLHYFGD